MYWGNQQTRVKAEGMAIILKGCCLSLCWLMHQVQDQVEKWTSEGPSIDLRSKKDAGKCQRASG